MTALENTQTARPAAPKARRTGMQSRSTPSAQERPLRTANRVLLGIAYALRPQNLLDVPHLLAWTVLDLLRGRTEIPSPDRTRSRPDTFGGVVRTLSPTTYMAACRLGFFPWAHCGPLKWWTRKRRMVLFLPEIRVSRRVRRLLRNETYRVTFDTAFDDVLAACAAPRAYNWHTLTWLSPRLMALYADLNREGFAHSFEVWNADGKLVGGGFGVAFGRMFVGESMFSLESDASKIGFAVLIAHLRSWGFSNVDGRDHTPMMEKLGFRLIPQAELDALLTENAKTPDRPGPWRAERQIALEAGKPREAQRVEAAA